MINMTDNKKIIFDFTPDGMKIETAGYTGSACEEEFKRIYAALQKEYGITLTATNDQKKPEYYNVNSGEKSQERV